LLGSSIGTWRHACLSQPDPDAAIARFESSYIAQSYSAKPSPREVSAVATDILMETLADEGAAHIINHPLLRNHVVTARAKGIASGTGTAAVTLGMGVSALANAIDRRLLRGSFRRVVFSAPEAAVPAMLRGFATERVSLSTDNLVSALKASGAIPLVLEPERQIDGAPLGAYWDGGIIDYHFEPQHAAGEGLVLYPHFTDTLTPGWFDKFLPWRSSRQPRGADLVLISPSRAFIADLPFGKIPDRRDFSRLSNEERQRYWRQCLSASQALADALDHLLDSSDPLAGVTRLPAY
jgi:hypothetical protein